MLRALSIRQPWCHHILNDGKDVENRSWSTKVRGTVLIHASKGVDSYDREEVKAKDMPLGGIVGMMDIVDCVTEMDSDWFYGEYGFVINNAVQLPFMPCKGALSFFKPDIQDQVFAMFNDGKFTADHAPKILEMTVHSFLNLNRRRG